MINNELTLHSVHTYPCKFPASVAKRYLQDRGVLLDPFVGSGTTLLEGAYKGMDTFGFDCNPIALLISKCKLINLNNDQFRKLEDLNEKFGSDSFKSKIGNFNLHNFDGKDHWFSKNSQNEFALLLSEINKFPKFTPEWTVMATVLSSITNKFSNQDSETRYAAVKKNHKIGDVIDGFNKKLYKTLISIRERGQLKNSKSNLTIGDIRDGLPLEDGSIDQIITSPPYANTMDYYLYHKHRMNLLGFNVKETQSREIGSRHEFSSKKQDPSIWDRDYKKGISEMLRVLKPSGHAIVVIGDSQISGKLISGAELTTKAVTDLGGESRILESVSMSGKSRSFRASFQAPNKFEHVIEVRK